MFGVIYKAIQLVCNTFLVLVVHNWTIIMRKKFGIISIIFLLSFSFLDPTVNNFDNIHGCPLRNQNDILDNPFPCKLTLSVYSIWSIKCRYDLKHAPQYKNKHTNSRGGHSIVKLKTMCNRKKSTFSKLHHQNGSNFYQILHRKHTISNRMTHNWTKKFTRKNEDE